jgi:hypothetical protein
MNLHQTLKSTYRAITQKKSSDKLLRQILSEWNADSQTRFEIYRYAYRERQARVFIKIFPKTAHWVGNESFRKMVQEYLQEFPPTSFQLLHGAKNFSRFVAKQSIAKKFKGVAALVAAEYFFEVSKISKVSAKFTLRANIALDQIFAGKKISKKPPYPVIVTQTFTIYRHGFRTRVKARESARLQ